MERIGEVIPKVMQDIKGKNRAMVLLSDAIVQCKVHAYAPREGKVVVAAYEAGELNHEACLYVIAELLTRLVDSEVKR